MRTRKKSNRVGVLPELLWDCEKSCTVCIDVLTIPGSGACVSGSEVVLSVLAPETADVDSTNFFQETDRDV